SAPREIYDARAICRHLSDRWLSYLNLAGGEIVTLHTVRFLSLASASLIGNTLLSSSSRDSTLPIVKWGRNISLLYLSLWIGAPVCLGSLKYIGKEKGDTPTKGGSLYQIRCTNREYTFIFYSLTIP